MTACFCSYVARQGVGIPEGGNGYGSCEGVLEAESSLSHLSWLGWKMLCQNSRFCTGDLTVCQSSEWAGVVSLVELVAKV